jgi:hypothetical protein
VEWNGTQSSNACRMLLLTALQSLLMPRLPEQLNKNQMIEIF